MISVVLVWSLRAVLFLGSILMAVQLYRTGLYRRYPVFFAFFLLPYSEQHLARFPRSQIRSLPADLVSPPNRSLSAFMCSWLPSSSN